MRRIFSYLILSLFLLSGTGVMMANRHNDRSHKEYTGNRHNSGKHTGNNNRPGNNVKPGGNKHHDDKNVRPGNNGNRPGKGDSYARPGGDKHKGHNNNHGRPGYQKPHHKPGHPRPHVKPTPPPPPHYVNLGRMVRYATRGAHDIDVWQIDYNTYMVRYRIGNVYYTRKLYPQRNAYGVINKITYDWMPQAPWIEVPLIQLNINI